ncbi:MAG TPA: hypothetical protein DD827_07950 [Gammaproteobacteria bacterium]|jgi:hypothetical protein|nr:hypothetical protein [Gammaproteobacteria bacterium]
MRGLLLTTITILFCYPAHSERQDVLATINLIAEPIWEITDINTGIKISSATPLRATVNKRKCLRSTSELSMKMTDSMGIDTQYYEGIGIQFFNQRGTESEIHQLRLHIADNQQSEQTWQVAISGKAEWTTLFLPFSEFQSSDKVTLDKKLISRISITSNETRLPSSLCFSDLYFYTQTEV